MSTSTALRVLGAGLLGIAALYLSVLNWIALVRRWSRPNTSSWIPFVGGVLGAFAVLVEPSGDLVRLWWLAFLVDAGSLPGFASVILQRVIKRQDPTQPRQ